MALLSDTRKKVLLDVFGHPLTLLPLVAGTACFILSWAFGWPAVLTLGGVFGWLIGGGSAVTRLATSGDKLLEKQRQYEHEAKLEEERVTLGALDKRLVKDRDSRTQTCLREIRKLFDILRDDVREGKVSGSGYRLLETVEALFHACVELLEESADLYETYKAMEKGTTARQRMKEQRGEKVQKCLDTTEHLREAIKQFHELKSKHSGTNIDKLREELDRQIEVARRVGRSTAELGAAETDVDYERFVNEQEGK